MKLKILLILTMLLGLKPSTQAHNYPSPKDSIVWTQLASNNFLEAIESYERIDGALHPFFEALYQVFTNRILGRTEKSIPYFQELIEGYLTYLDPTLSETCFWLMSGFSERAYNEEKLLWLRQKLREYANEPDHSLPISREKVLQLQNEIERALLRLKEPRFHYTHRKHVDSLLFKYTHSKIQAPITLNGRPTSAIIDTGASGMLAMHYKTALKFGLRVKLEEGQINGAKARIANIRLDSMRVGSTTFYNIPTTIYDLNPIDTLSLPTEMDSALLIPKKQCSPFKSHQS